MLSIEALTKRYRRSGPLAIDQVELSVRPGEVVGLVGLNGAGKTTTIRIAAGIILPDSGSVRINGFDIQTQKPQASRFVGWVPETPNHESGGRLESLLRYYAELAGTIPNGRTSDLLETWGLAEYRQRPFRTLSMGMRKRFALAVAELQDPTFYLLDELMGGLDPPGIAQARNWVTERRKAGCGVLLSSHQLRELQSLSDRIVVIHHGKVRGSYEKDAIPVSRRRRFIIGLDRVDDAVLKLLRTFGEVEVSAQTVRLDGMDIDPGVVSAAIVRAGYSVRRLETEDGDLEAYFLKLVGETQ